MTENEFTEFVKLASLRVTRKVGRIGHLTCTQSNHKGEPMLREPEICSAFQQEAENRGLFYGIEVPTKHSYRFSAKGETGRSALVDFALLTSDKPKAERTVLVEFKQGQPASKRSEDSSIIDYPTISKDMHKLWAEPVHHGCCMFHICQAADEKTIKEIKVKYNAVTQNAIKSASDTMRLNLRAVEDSRTPDCWFLLFILVIHQRGEKTGSVLHQATWQEDHWEFEDPDSLL